MISSDILKALQDAVTASRLGTTIPTMPIKYVGISAVQGIDKYLEIVHVENDRPNDFWGDERNYQGSLRIILHWPVAGDGAMPGKRYMDAIANYFVKGRILRYGSANVQIYQPPLSMGVLESGAELLFPLVIPYRCFSLT